MAAGAIIPGTSYRLDGGVLAADLYVSPGGCILVRAAEGTPGATPISVPVIRADGKATTYALGGVWKPTNPGPACFAKVSPKSHFEHFIGHLTQAPDLVAGTAARNIDELRTLVATQLPALRPFIALAEQAIGFDLGFVTDQLLAGAAAAGIPVDTIQDFIASPASAVQGVIAQTAMQVGIDPSVLGLVAPPPPARPSATTPAQPLPLAPGVRRIWPTNLCLNAANQRVDCATGAILDPTPVVAPTRPKAEDKGWGWVEISVLFIALALLVAGVVALWGDE